MWLAYTSFEIWVAATPGKFALGLRISAQDCGPADRWTRVLRWSTKHFWLLAAMLFALTEFGPLRLLAGFSSLIFAIGCLFASNDDKLAWHDQWAHTAVCKRRREYQAFEPIMPLAPPPLPPEPQSPSDAPPSPPPPAVR